MNISELSIRRPVLATVLTVIILLFGYDCLDTFSIREIRTVLQYFFQRTPIFSQIIHAKHTVIQSGFPGKIVDQCFCPVLSQFLVPF